MKAPEKKHKISRSYLDFFVMDILHITREEIRKMNVLEYDNALNYCLTTYIRRDIPYTLGKMFGNESKKPAMAPQMDVEIEYENKKKIEDYEEKCAEEQEIERQKWLESLEGIKKHLEGDI